MRNQASAHTFSTVLGKHKDIAQPIFILRERSNVMPFEHRRTQQYMRMTDSGKSQWQIIVPQALVIIAADFIHRRPWGKIMPFFKQSLSQIVNMPHL